MFFEKLHIINYKIMKNKIQKKNCKINWKKLKNKHPSKIFQQKIN